MLEEEAIARIGIGAMIASYSDAVNRRDEAAWASCWAAEAQWNIHGQHLTGSDAIVGAWRKAMTGYANVWFMAFVGNIELDGREAALRTHTFEYLLPLGGAPRLQSGLYADRVIEREGRWVFLERQFSSQELKL